MIESKITTLRIVMLAAACLPLSVWWPELILAVLGGFGPVNLMYAALQQCVVAVSCEPICSTCPPEQISLTTAGVVDGTCSNCEAMNSTFVVNNHTFDDFGAQECQAPLSENGDIAISCTCGVAGTEEQEFDLEFVASGSNTIITVTHRITGSTGECNNAVFESSSIGAKPADCAASRSISLTWISSLGVLCDQSAETCDLVVS